MYAAYFGLKQEPFSIAPDPRLLFLGEQHREALAHLLYGVRCGGGFVLLTGEIGTGKTTVCRAFLQQLPAHCNLAYIFNPRLTVPELLETICHEFGVALPARSELRPATVKDYLDPLNAFLLQAHADGRSNVLVIDEAQNLAADVLEQLRLLTNLETSERKLLQIVLIGQPELRELLARPELEQLAQRVAARYHLGPLAQAQTALYVRHRLEACGLERPMPFDARALRRVHRASGGVPRRINLLCDRALLGAFATGEARVTPRILERAAAEVFAARRLRWPPLRRTALAGLVGAAVGAGLLAASGMARRHEPVTIAVAPRAAIAAATAIAAPATFTTGEAPLVSAAAGTAPTIAGGDTAPTLAGGEAAPTLAGGEAAPTLPGTESAPTRAGTEAALMPAGAGTRPTAASAGAPPTAPAAAAASAMAPARARASPTEVLAGAPADAPPGQPASTAAQPRLLRDEQAAWRELAAAWTARLPAVGDACATLARQALQCFRRTLSLPMVRVLARPGIVTLDAGTGQPSYALLVGLDDAAVTLRAAGSEQRVSLAALAARWNGEFATLWRTPPGYRGRLAEGERGPAVDWLAEHLGPGTAPAVFDGALRARIRAFQTARGLTADGRPGPLTYMELNRVAGVDEPRLPAQP